MKIRESCLQTGNFIYKPGISVTKQDFHLQTGILGLQMGFSGYYLPSLAIFTPIIWFSDRKNMDIYSLFGNIGFVLVLNKEVNQIKNSARLKENLQKILGLDCYHKTWITISKSKDEEITLTMLFFSKKEFACFERKIDKKYIVEKENGFGTLVTMQIRGDIIWKR